MDLTKAKPSPEDESLFIINVGHIVISSWGDQIQSQRAVCNGTLAFTGITRTFVKTEVTKAHPRPPKSDPGDVAQNYTFLENAEKALPWRSVLLA